MSGAKDTGASGYLLVLLTAVVALTLWSAVAPHDRATWVMEALPVLLAVPLLLATRRRFPLTLLAYTLVAIHAAILLVGAHYTYAEVPLFNWLRDEFSLSRNHYDRVGHFAQGAVPAMVIRELLLRTSPLRPGKWLAAIIVFSCLGISGLYEVIEWAAAVLSADGAEAFLATQGDVWDTQKDITLAGVGACCSMLLLSHWHDALLRRLPQGVFSNR